MRLLFDLAQCQPSKNGTLHGGGVYGETILLRLLKINSDIELFCIYDSSKPIKPTISNALENNKIKIIDIQNKAIKNIISEYSIDTFYAPLPLRYTNVDIENCRFIGTIHDLRKLEIPIHISALYYCTNFTQRVETIIKILLKKFMFKKRLKEIKLLLNNNSFRYITVSNHSKYSIRNFFPEHFIDETPIFYSPLTDQVNPSVSFLKNNNLKKHSYYLMISGNRWEKNILKAAQAFDEIVTTCKDFPYKIVISGVVNKKVYTGKLKNRNRFFLLDYISDEELHALYKGAYAFIYPSLNEGFGYPPVEAMKYGTPSAVSGVSSIPEICGSASIYFDPNSIVDIKIKILQLTSPQVRADLNQKIIPHYEKIKNKQDVDLDNLIKYITNYNQ